jgi:hypothetical protein
MGCDKIVPGKVMCCCGPALPRILKKIAVERKSRKVGYEVKSLVTAWWNLFNRLDL